LKAAVLENNGVITVKEVMLGEPAADECLLRIAYSGICSSDIYRAFDSGAYHYPLIMGHEFSGVIEKIGSGVLGFEVGDRVAVFPLLPCFSCKSCNLAEYSRCFSYQYYGSRNDGAFSEYLSVKAWNLIKIPDNVKMEDAALTEPFAVVLHGLNKLELPFKGESSELLLIGAGFLGLLFLELINFFGINLNVTVLDRSDFKLDLAKKLGAKTINAGSSEALAQFMDNYQSHFDIVAEFSGSPVYYEKSVRFASHGGQILWLSNISGDLNLTKQMVSQILRKELKILGTWNSSYKKNLNDDWKEALNLFSNGFRPSKYVDGFINLEELPETLNKMFNHKMGKEKLNYIKYAIKGKGFKPGE
jgi:L-iditol 2-dehydrogenase